MDQALTKFIGDALVIADRRNLAPDNPVVIEIPHHNELYRVVVSLIEPAHLIFPFNVTWIVADQEDLNYGKALRRVGRSSLGTYRNTWATLETYDDILAEPQFYDLNNTFQLGELGGITDVVVAETDRRGIVVLNGAPTNASDPVVVSDSDIRMRNPRDPLQHSHPLLPATQLHGNSGLTPSHVTINLSNSPVAGQVLTVTGRGGNANEFEAQWKYLEQDSIVYDGAAFTSLRINAPQNNTVNEETTIRLTADALFSDGGEVLDVNPTWMVLSGSRHVLLDTVTGSLTTAPVDGDQTVSLRATWTHGASGETRSADVTLTISDQTIPVFLDRIEIAGPITLDEDTTASYTVIAYYDDMSSAGIVPATFTTSNADAGILDPNTGLFSAPTKLTANEQTTLSATYTEDGITKSATLQIMVRDTTVYPASATLLGPVSVNEGQTVTYQMEIRFTDLTSRVVAVTDWAIDNPALGSIDAATGEFVPEADVTSNLTGMLTASYEAEGVTVGIAEQITLVDTTVYPQSAQILGPSSVDEGTAANYSLEVTFSDSSVTIVPVTDWSASNTAGGTIDPVSGEFTAVENAGQNELVIISASYDGPAGTSVDAELTVTVIDTTNYPVSAHIVGQDSVDEGTSVSYALQVTYLDGTTVQESPTDWTSTDTAVGTIVADTGLFTAAQNVLENSNTNIEASFTVHGRTVSDVKPIVVADTTNYPVSATITGPDNLNENTSHQYTLDVEFADGTTQTVVADGWSSSNTNLATANALNGEITAAQNIQATASVTISSSYTLDGRSVSASKVINIVDTTVYPVSARIEGPIVVNENTSVQYTLVVRFDDNNELTMDATDWTHTNAAAGSIGAATGAFDAPTNITADETTVISASFTRDGITVSDTIEVTVTDSTIYPASATVLGSDLVNENNSASYQLEVTFTDNSTSIVSVSDWSSDDLNLATINANTGLLVAAADVAQDGSVNISASYTADGVTVTGTKSVTIHDSTEYPVSMVLVGPTSLDEGTTASYAVDVTYTSGAVVRESPTTIVSSNVSVASFTGTDLTASDVFGDQTTEVTASFNSAGKTINVSQTITVVDTTNYPASAAILGQNNIDEGGTATYTLEVTMDDGTVRTITDANWTSDSTDLAIVASTGVATAAANVVGNQIATIGASFSENGKTVSADRQINIIDTTIYPVSGQIVGQSVVAEGATVAYTFSVTWSDNSTTSVIVDDWALDNPAAGTLAANGTLSAADNLTADVAAIISASYTVDGTTVSDTLNINVVDTTVYPQSAEITGANAIDEGGTSQLAFNVTYTNDLVVGVNSGVTWSSSNSSVADVDANGLVTGAAALTGDSTATITASYTEEGVTVTDDFIVTVRDTTVYPQSAEILGNTAIDENTTASYSLRVTWTDNSTTIETVNTWSSDNASAPIDSSGTVTVGELTADLAFRVGASFTAEGQTVSATLDVVASDTTNYPASAVILGANGVNEGSPTTTYTLQVTYEDSTTATVVVTDWASSNTAVGTIGADTGVFTAATDVPANATTELSASYTEHGRTVNATKIVTVYDTDVYPQSAQILGPLTVDENSTASFLFEVTYDDASTATVAVDDWASNNAALTIVAGTGSATTGEVAADTPVQISASYTENGQTVSATHDLTVRNIVPVVTSLTVAGPNSVNEQETAAYTVTANYDNSSTADVTSSSTFTATHGSFVGNTYTAPDVTEDTVETITVTYDDNGTAVTEQHTLTIVYVPPMPVSAQITGASSLFEGAAETYDFVVTYDDNSTAVKTVAWTSDNVALSIDGTGAATAQEVSVDTVATLSASYTENGATVSDTLAVTVMAIVPQSIAIGGATTTPEDTPIQMSATVTMNNGTTSDVTSTTGWTVDSGTIDANGLYTPTDVASDTNVTISASYTADGVTVTDTYSVTVTDVAQQAMPMHFIAPFSGVDFAYQPNATDLQSFIDNYATDLVTVPDATSPYEFTTVTGNDQFSYFMWPASFAGTGATSVMFYSIDDNLSGGWDGAKMTDPLGFPDDYGSNDVMYNGELWHVWRVDWPDLGTRNWRLTYPAVGAS